MNQKLTKASPTVNSKLMVLATPMEENTLGKGTVLCCYLGKIYQLKFCRLMRVNESCYVEVIRKKTKWAINYSCNPTKNKISLHLEFLIRNLDLYTSKIEDILMIGDLNISMEDNNMKHFLWELQSEKSDKTSNM